MLTQYSTNYLLKLYSTSQSPECRWLSRLTLANHTHTENKYTHTVYYVHNHLLMQECGRRDGSQLLVTWDSLSFCKHYNTQSNWKWEQERRKSKWVGPIQKRQRQKNNKIRHKKRNRMRQGALKHCWKLISCVFKLWEFAAFVEVNQLLLAFREVMNTKLLH